MKLYTYESSFKPFHASPTLSSILLDPHKRQRNSHHPHRLPTPPRRRSNVLEIIFALQLDLVPLLHRSKVHARSVASDVIDVLGTHCDGFFANDVEGVVGVFGDHDAGGDVVEEDLGCDGAVVGLR